MSAEVDGLKELVEAKAAACRRLCDSRFEALDRLLVEREATHAKALQLQAAEYERRLEMLNGEAGRLRSMRDEFVPKASYNIEVPAIKEDVDGLKEYRSRTQGKEVIVAGIVALAVSLIVVGVGVLLK